MLDYLRYYLGPLSVAVGLMGFALGDAWVWLGFGTYFVLAVFDILLPRDLAERHMNNPLLADLPLPSRVPDGGLVRHLCVARRR